MSNDSPLYQTCAAAAKYLFCEPIVEFGVVCLCFSILLMSPHFQFKLGSLQLVACPNSGEVVCRMLDFSVENVADLQVREEFTMLANGWM